MLTCHYCRAQRSLDAVPKLFPVVTCEECHLGMIGNKATHEEWLEMTQNFRTKPGQTFEEQFTDYDRAFFSQMERAFA